MNNTYCYIRISTEKQEYDRQELIMNEHGYFNNQNCIFLQETISGKSKKRPILQEMLSKIKKDDKVVITDISRLARSVSDLWSIADIIVSKGGVLVSFKENIDLGTSTGKMLFSIMGAIVQWERDNTSDKTKESLRAKKNKGIILGRPLENDVSEIIELHSQGLSAKQISEQTKININTVYHHIRKGKEKQNG